MLDIDQYIENAISLMEVSVSLDGTFDRRVTDVYMATPEEKAQYKAELMEKLMDYISFNRVREMVSDTVLETKELEFQNLLELKLSELRRQLSDDCKRKYSKANLDKLLGNPIDTEQ